MRDTPVTEEVHRAAMSYIYEYGTKYMAIGAIEHRMTEERVKIIPNARHLQFLASVKKYLKDVPREELRKV